MTNRKQILVENTMWVYLAKVFTQLISLLASVLVLRQLDVDVYGTYVFLFGLFTAYQLLITSPLKHVLLRFVPELRNKVSPSSLFRLIVIYVFVALLMVVVLTVLGIIFKDSLAHVFNIDSLDTHFKPFLFFVFSYAIKILFEVLLSALLLHRRMAVLNMVLALSRAIAYLILLQKLDVNLLLTIEASVSLIYVLPALFVLVRSLKFDNDTNEDISQKVKHRMKRFWLYSLFTELGAGLIGRTSDYYIVAALSNPYFVGLYGFAVKIYELFYKILPFKEFESVLKPLVFDKYSSGEINTSLNQFYNFTVKVLLPFFILPFMYFFLFGKEIIVEVFGDKYIDAYWTTVLILGGFVIDGLFYPLSILIHLKEKMHILLISRLVVVFSLLAGIYMMKNYGIVGVAIATSSGQFLKNIFMFLMFRKKEGLHYDYKIFTSNIFLMIILLMLIYPLHLFLMDVLMLVTGSLIFGLVYVLYLLNFHSFRKDELDYLNSILRSNSKTSKLYTNFSKLINKLVLFKNNE